jgi:adhesin/invasin
MRRFVNRAGLIMAAVVLGACGGGSGTGNNGTITIAKAPALSGDAQTGEVGHALASDLRVLVTEDGVPKAGESVTFTATGGSTNPAIGVSDVNGIAKTTWTLGTVSGAQSVTASLRAAIGSPLTFTGTATPGPVVAISKFAGDFQTGVPNLQFPQAISVRAVDSHGNGVPSVQVGWTVASGPVSIDANGSATNGQGLASMPVTAGATSGQAIIQATSPSMPIGFHLDFTLTVSLPPKVVNASGAGLGTAFTSATNASSNPAVDTISVGEGIRWVQTSGGHTVASTGVPSFTGTNVQLTPTGYTFVFTAAGTYTYECGIHGASMTGTVVVQ